MREVIETDSHVVISALTGDAAAGGVPFALAADHVVAREDVVLNPYYRHMGGLYGSEYWTYLLPRRVGQEHDGRARPRRRSSPSARAARSRSGCSTTPSATTAEQLPRRACAVSPSAWRATRRPRALAGREASRARAATSSVKPLAAYRAEELARSHECFFGPDRSYHEARRRFVYKLGAPCAVAPPAVGPRMALRAGDRLARGCGS